MINFAPADRDNTRASTLECLNAVALTGAQFEAAMRAVAALPEQSRHSPAAQALALQAFADHEGIAGSVFASAALHARMAALDAWTRDHDPRREANAEAVMEAAAHQSLSQTENGIGFDPVSFGELILFVEELPF